jgi:outer membrane protein TolC
LVAGLVAGPMVHLAADTGLEEAFPEVLFPELEAYLRAVADQGQSQRLGVLTVEERVGDLDVAKAQRGPSVRFWGRFMGSYEVREDIDNVARGDVSSNLTVAQPLYRWGNLKRQEAIAGQQVELAELDRERRVARELIEARQLYLGLLLHAEQARILERSTELSGQFVEARRQLVEVGQFSEQDVLEMEARLLENRERLGWTRKRLLEHRQALERLTGLPVEVGALAGRLEQIEPMSAVELAALREATLGREPLTGFEGRQWQLMESIEAERLNILEKRNWPEFDFVAGAYSDRLDAVYAQDSVFRLRGFAGLQVSWNIFDNWQTKGYQRGALARKRAYALRQRFSAEEDERRLAALFADLELTLAQIEARGKREVLLERRLELLQQYAEENRVTGSERLEGEIDYLEVRQRLLEARVSYLTNLLQIALLLDKDPFLRDSRD